MVKKVLTLGGSCRKALSGMGGYMPFPYNLRYPVLRHLAALIFLVDFYLTWKQTENMLRGDIATNISSGLARIFGFIGKLLYLLRRREK